MTDILQAIRNELVQASPLTYVPTRGQPFPLTFHDDGTCEGGPMVSWTVVYGGTSTNVPTLLMKNGDGCLQASLTLDKATGRFKGRERDSNGASACFAQGRKAEAFRLLAEPAEWYKSQQEVTGEAGNYLKQVEVAENTGPQVDWSPFEYNLADVIDRSKLVQSDTAAALIACDRHPYFQRMVEGLAKNPEIHQMPVFLFLDVPWRDARKEEVEAHKQIVRTHLPHCVIVARPRNYGCGRNIIDARVQLFTNMGYDRVFIFEDDMVPTPQYMKLCQNMLAWALAEYTNVGAVQAWNKCIMSQDAKNQLLNEVHVTYTNWWGYLQTAESWKAIEPMVLQYQNLFLGGQYSHRPHRTILKFFDQIRSTSPTVLGDRPYVLDGESWNRHRVYFDAPPTGQDAITMHTFEQAGFVRLAPRVNRGVYIGRYGIHMHPRMYERDGFQNVEYVEYPEDVGRMQFVERGRTTIIPSEPLDEVPRGLEIVEQL